MKSLFILLSFLGAALGNPDPYAKLILESNENCSFTAHFQHFSQQRATLLSPNYPSEYPNNANCVWRFRSPSDTRIKLECEEFDVENHSQCNWDSVTVAWDGEWSAQNGDKICGRKTVRGTSDSNTLSVRFRSDVSNPSGASAYKFKCAVSMVEPQTSSGPTATFADQSCSCGTRNRASNRIVGGTVAAVNEFPWRVALSSRASGGSSFCTGAVISPNWVMTAAHCTIRRQNVNQVPTYVILAEHDLSTTTESQSQVIKCKRIVNHPAYDSSTLDNDISLCELERPLTYSRTIQPVCLPWAWASESFQNTTVTASGWGTTEFRGDGSNVLLRVDMPVLTTEECRAYLGQSRITNNMFCTYEPGKDTCQGDSGGSIDYQDPNSGRYFGIGIVSWGIGCAGENRPGVYAKVTNYLNWITQTTGREQYCR